MKGDIVLTHDVEVVEMQDLGASSKNKHGAGWSVTTPQPEAADKSADWMDGFRRAERRPLRHHHHRDPGYLPTSRPTTSGAPKGDRYDIRAANLKTANTALARDLKGRHLQMIAFGGAIGTGLFVASGASLYNGGPATLLLSYVVIGAMQYCTMQALGELCVLFPIAGSFSAFSTRFLDPSWGFAMGWNYCLNWLIVLPLEIIAATFTVSYWNENISKLAFVTIFLLAIIIINLFGVKAYGEAEFLFSTIKVVAIIAFILLAAVINIGGKPHTGYIGGQYWQDPGPFKNSFKGFCSVLVTSSASFTGTELIGLAAAEAENPRKSLPSAIKQVFWRIVIFYIVSLLLVTLLVPSDEPRLIDGQNNADAKASPFVIAIEAAGETILPSIMNGVILIAVISVGNSAVFGSSRTLLALAEQSHAPRIFTYVDKQGRPLVAILFAALVGLISFLAESKIHNMIFNWLLSISALSTLCTWGSICLCHIRFRKAWKLDSRPLEHLPFRSNVGTIGSWAGIAGYVLVLVSQLWIAISPINNDHTRTPTTGDRVQTFFLRVMTIPIVLAFYILHKIWFRTRVVKVTEMDIDTGRRYFRVHVSTQQEKEERVNWPLWKKVYRILC